MPTHIDVQCGHYHNVVVDNRRGIEADRKYYDKAGAMNFYSAYRIHNYHFAIYGAMDTNVPPGPIEDAVRQVAGPGMGVILEGETHSLTNAAHHDIRAWELLFFDTWLRDDATARRQLATGTSVRGGVTDRKTLQHAATARP